MEEEKRLTAIECLAHPFFDGMRNDEIETLVQGHLQLKQQQIQSSALIHGSVTGQREQSKSRVSVRSTAMQSNDVI